MEWYRIRPAQLLADVRIHGLSFEAQGVLAQLMAVMAQYDGALSLPALIDELRPRITNEHVVMRELAPVLATYLGDVREQTIAYAEKSRQAKAAGRVGGQASALSRANATAPAQANASPIAVAPAQAKERKTDRSSPLPPEGEEFDQFWQAYPKKAAKAGAQRAWRKLAPDAMLVGDILAALAWQCRSSQWTRDGGQYVPLPASWLRDRRWEDVRPVADVAERALPTPDWAVPA